MKSDRRNQLTSAVLIPGSPHTSPQLLCDMLIGMQTSVRMLMMCKNQSGKSLTAFLFSLTFTYYTQASCFYVVTCSFSPHDDQVPDQAAEILHESSLHQS